MFRTTAVLVIACVQSITAAHAAPFQSAGTLACTVDPGAGRSHELSCSFQPRGDGATARFRGSIARLGADERLEAHRALIWLVLGPPDLDATDLEGRFIRKNRPGGAVEERFRKGLIGGAGGTIALVPPSGREQISGNAALTVIDLSLSALRT
jgi:hypothetical protein